MSKKKTAKFVMLPWLKGLDSDTDEGIMQFIKKGDHLTEATNIVYGLDGSKTKRDGYAYHDSAAITGAPEIIGGHDYWSNVSSRKSQRIVVWDNQATSKCWFQYGAGGQAWTELTMKAEYELEGVTIKTDAPTSLKSVCFEVFNDDLIMAFTDSQNAGRPPVKWNNMTGTEYETLGGFPPNCKYVRKHQGRLWMAGDPNRPDSIYFSSPGNHEEWQGAEDSGRLDIDPGDGDHSGITAIFPSFRGILFVCKANAIYKVVGNTPETYKIEPVTFGLGCISHNSAVAVDMDDIYFASERGFHSLVVTEKFGDFEGAFLSASIQNDFLELSMLHKPYIQGVWIPSSNSVMWNVSRDGTTMDTIWLHDVRFKAWYKWDGALPSALFKVEDVATKIKKAYFGDTTGRVSRTQEEGVKHDYAATAITQTVSTPFIYPDNDPATIKGIKKIGIWVKMPEAESVTVTVELSGYNDKQTLVYTSNLTSTAKLDIDFILGVNILDESGVLRMTPYTLPVDGYCSAVKLTFTNGDVDSYCAIFGFWIEWEPAGDTQESVGV